MYHRVYYTSLYCLHIFIYQELQKKKQNKTEESWTFFDFQSPVCLSQIDLINKDEPKVDTELS